MIKENPMLIIQSHQQLLECELKIYLKKSWLSLGGFLKGMFQRDEQ